MATGGSNSSDTCSICTEKFTNPKILPCFHSFCLDCLHQFVSSSSKDGQFPCPMCRYQVTLPSEGVAGFQTNFYIEARTEKQLHHAGECCAVCEQRANHACRECKMILCDSCTKCHKTLPSTRSHMLINLSDSDSEKPVQKFCEKHVEEKLRFYCKPCNKVICRDCKLTNHDGHTTEDISDVVGIARESLAKTKVKLENVNTEINEKLELISRTDTGISENLKTIQMELNVFFDSLVDMINTIRHQQINKATYLEGTRRTKLTDEQNILSQRKCLLQSLIDQCDTMFKEGLDSDVIDTDGEMKQRLIEVEKQQSIGSDCDSKPLYIPPKPGQLNLVRDDISKSLINVFTQSDKTVPLRSVKRIENTKLFVRSISFTKSQKLISAVGEDDVSVFCETPDLGQIKLCDITMDELRKDGVHGAIDKYKKEVPLKKRITDHFADLKKPFLFMDTNADGDSCSIDDKNNVVVIKSMEGVLTTLTFNPFAKTGQEFQPVDVCWGNNKEVYIADKAAKVIIVYSLQYGFQKSLTPPSKSPLSAIAINKGKLWVGNEFGNINICGIEE